MLKNRIEISQGFIVRGEYPEVFVGLIQRFSVLKNRCPGPDFDPGHLRMRQLDLLSIKVLVVPPLQLQ